MSKPSTPSIRSRIRHYIAELRRRHVVQVTGVYLVAVWGLSAGAADIFAALDLPAYAARYLIIGLFSLTPLVVAVSWLFEVDRSGIYWDQGSDQTLAPAEQPASNTDPGALVATFKDLTRSFTDDFTVGRDESCELQILDPLVSRRHSCFERIDGRWRVRDLGSANGTTVDGTKTDTAWIEGQVVVTLYPGCPDLLVSTVVDTAADTVFIDR